MGCYSSKAKSVTTKGRRRESSLHLNPGTFLAKSKGRLSNNYTFVKKLGSGAFADVDLCLYKPLNQQRAVKTIHKSGLHSQQMDKENMLKEIAILTSLDHPNILKCYEIFEDNWKFYVATDYCAGGELFDRIVKLKKFTEFQAAEIIFQLLSAVAYCHDRSVIHRDLKPENILLEELDNSLSIKVADFGSSCFLDSKKKLSGCFGSAYYVAPEVLAGEYNEKCDIWSTGVIMFILLTGRPPYNGRDENMILDQVKNTPLQIQKKDWPNLSQDAVDFLQNLLVVSPKSRFSARKALEHQWIKTFREKQDHPNLAESLAELSTFTSSSNLKNAVHVFLATQAISHEELKTLKEDFLTIDTNGDGKISKNELLHQYLKTMDQEEANQIVEKIMKEVDIDQSGDIDYTEFLTGCMNFNNYNSKKILEAAFAIFDKDGSGDISVNEIKAVLGTGNKMNNEMWNEIITEVDQNGDGVIDLKEFIQLMTKKL